MSPSASIAVADPFRHAMVGVHVEQDGAGVADERRRPAHDDAARRRCRRAGPSTASRTPRQAGGRRSPRPKPPRRPGRERSPRACCCRAPSRRGRARAPRTRRWSCGPRSSPSAANSCGSGISSIDSRKPPRSAKAKVCRVPSGRTVSTEAPAADRAGPDARLRRKRGGTPSSNTSSTASPSGVAIRFGSSGRVVAPKSVAVSVVMPVPMPMMMAAAEQPGARDIDREAEGRDRDGFAEMDRHRVKEARRPPPSRSAARSSPGRSRS